MELIIGSMALKVKGKGMGRLGGGERKPISGFSNSARRNLLWKLQTLDYEGLQVDGWTAWFITLTYRDEFYREAKNLIKAKQDLHTFFIYLNRLLPLEYFSFWKFEFTKQSIPHFHLFMCVNGNIPHKKLITYIQNTWLMSISPYGKHLELMEKASTNVRYTPMDKVDVLSVYISKEIGKNYQVNVPEGELPGRFWGISNRKHYRAYIKEDTLSITETEFYRLRRILRGWLKSKGYKFKTRARYQGATAYYIDAETFSDALLRYLGVVR